MYQIDYPKWVALLLPTFLRSGRVLSILRALVHPLESLNKRRCAAREATLFDLQHTGQTCYLRDALNSQCGGGFEIEDIPATGKWLMAYKEAPNFSNMHLLVEDAPNYRLIYNEDKIKHTTQFLVRYPPNLSDGELNQAKKIVEKYRLASSLPIYEPKITNE